MKKLLFLLLLIGYSNTNFAQQATLVYDCKRDSNDYLKNIRDLNGQLFFQRSLRA